MNYVNIKQLNDDILNNIYKIPSDVDLIVGIPRSGMIVATLISVYLNKPLTDLESFINKKIYESGSTKNTSNCVKSFDEVKKAIVIDDSIASGKSLLNVKSKIENVNLNIDIIYLVPYIVEDAKNKCDIYFRIIDLPRKFEWNLFHHVDLERACVDIDGVLCIDPKVEENDDGTKYEEFLKNAKVKYKPSRKIGYLVTSRLEKYRKITEEWLEKHNIEYGELIMMENISAEERRRRGSHGEFKGKVYKKIKDSILFIESEQVQAEEIKMISGKSVICVDNECVFVNKKGIKNRIKNKLKKFLKKFLSENQIKKIKRILGE